MQLKPQHLLHELHLVHLCRTNTSASTPLHTVEPPCLLQDPDICVLCFCTQQLATQTATAAALVLCCSDAPPLHLLSRHAQFHSYKESLHSTICWCYWNCWNLPLAEFCRSICASKERPTVIVDPTRDSIAAGSSSVCSNYSWFISMEAYCIPIASSMVA